MRAWLLDTGPLVAYLNSLDGSHQAVANCLDRFAGQLFTTSAVITEAMHFLKKAPRGPALLAEFVGQSELLVVDFSEAGELAEAARRMEQYANVPMDFADATLVLLAERMNIFELVTLDRRGFSVFRTSGGKHFSLVLDQAEPKS